MVLNKIFIKVIIVIISINIIHSNTVYAQCPQIEGVLVNSCSADGNREGIDEYVVFNTSSSQLPISDLKLTFPNQTYCNAGGCTSSWGTNGNNFISSILAPDCPPGTFIEVNPSTGIIPANAKVIVFTGLNPEWSYDFSGACSSGPYYVVFANNTTGQGRFANSGGARSLSLQTSTCASESVTYTAGGNTNSNGDYVRFDTNGNPTYIGTGAACAPNTTSIPPVVTLPIELLKFTASMIDNQVKLEWVTVMENNNDYFIIERSTDGVTFEEIGRVKGAGNSNALLQYDFYDEDFISNSYYRLKQVDFNKQYSYSTIIKIAPEENFFWFQLFPVPASEDLSIQLYSSKGEESVSIEIMDLLSKAHVARTSSLMKGLNTIKMDVSFLAIGSYFVTITSSESKRETKAIQILR